MLFDFRSHNQVDSTKFFMRSKVKKALFSTFDFLIILVTLKFFRRLKSKYSSDLLKSDKIIWSPDWKNFQSHVLIFWNSTSWTPLIKILVFLMSCLFLNNHHFPARAMVHWLRQTAHDQEIVGSNPGTVYWMDVNDARYYINTQN